MADPRETAAGIAEHFARQGLTAVVTSHAAVMRSEARALADGILYAGRTPAGELLVYFRPYARDVPAFQAATGWPGTEIAFPPELVDRAEATGRMLNAACRFYTASGTPAPFEVVGTRKAIDALVAAINDPARARPPRG